MKTIAFFDFDGTITTKDTLLEFIKFTQGNRAFITGFLLNSPYLAAYKLKLISNQLAKEKIIDYYFKNTPLARFQKWGDAFSTEILPRLLRPKAMVEIQKLQQSGATLVIVSASFGNWIQHWAAANSLHLIATGPEVRDGKLTGRIEGKNCHGYEKVRRIHEAFRLDDYESIHAYGDTAGDKPMLALATHAHYKPFRR